MTFSQSELNIDELLTIPCTDFDADKNINLTSTYSWNFNDPLYPKGALRIKLIHNNQQVLCKNDLTATLKGNTISIHLNSEISNGFNLLQTPQPICGVTILEITPIKYIKDIKFSINEKNITLKNDAYLLDGSSKPINSFSKTHGFFFTSSILRHPNGNIASTYNYLIDIESKRDYKFYTNGNLKSVYYNILGIQYRTKKFKRNGKLISDRYHSDKYQCHLDDDCENSSFEANTNQVNLLNELMKKIKNSTTENKTEYEDHFFCAFPNSFNQVLDLLHVEHQKHKEDYKSTGKLPALHLQHPWFSLFSELNTIEPERYYNKYFNLCIDGFYGADYITKGFEIYKRFETDTQTICRALIKREDVEIKSIFRFIFDSSHPNNEINWEIFNSIYPLIHKENKKLSRFLKLEFQKLIKERQH